NRLLTALNRVSLFLGLSIQRLALQMRSIRLSAVLVSVPLVSAFQFVLPVVPVAQVVPLSLQAGLVLEVVLQVVQVVLVLRHFVRFSSNDWVCRAFYILLGNFDRIFYTAFLFSARISLHNRCSIVSSNSCTI